MQGTINNSVWNCYRRECAEQMIFAGIDFPLNANQSIEHEASLPLTLRQPAFLDSFWIASERSGDGNRLFAADVRLVGTTIAQMERNASWAPRIRHCRRSSDGFNSDAACFESKIWKYCNNNNEIRQLSSRLRLIALLICSFSCTKECITQWAHHMACNISGMQASRYFGSSS